MTVVPETKTHPYIQLANWIMRPLAYLETNLQRYGDLFHAHWGVLDWVLVSHPTAIKQMLTQDMGATISAPGELNGILQPLFGPNSVILLSGQAHRNRRRLIMPPLHGDHLKVYAELIQQITQSVMATLTTGQTFNAREVMQQITMRVILSAVFGLHEGDRYERLEALLAQRLNMLSSPIASTMIFFPVLQTDIGPLSPGAKLAALTAETDALLYAEIRERRAHPDSDREDILSLLLLAKDEAGQGLSDEELHDELITLLIAGHETTATALTWSLYWTHHHPAIKAQIQQEIAAAHAATDPLTLTQLPYLEAVCHETLRIYPVAMLTFGRLAQQPLTLLDYEIPPETMLVASIYLLHRRPDLYPEPEVFRPERFLERQFSPFEFMPFGAGSRRCVGAALALYELKIVLGTLLTQYDLTLARDRPAQPERRGLTLGMKGGVEMVLHSQRSTPQPALV